MVQLETVGSQRWTIVNYISVSLFTFNETIILYLNACKLNCLLLWQRTVLWPFLGGLLFFMFAVFSWSVIVWYAVWKQVQNIGWMSVDLRNFFGRFTLRVLVVCFCKCCHWPIVLKFLGHLPTSVALILRWCRILRHFPKLRKLRTIAIFLEVSYWTMEERYKILEKTPY